MFFQSLLKFLDVFGSSSTHSDLSGTLGAFVFGAAGLLPEMRLHVEGIETPLFSQGLQLARQHVIRELLLVWK